MTQPRRWKDRNDGSPLTVALRDAHAATGDAARIDRAWQGLEPIALSIAAEQLAPNAGLARARPLSGAGTKLLLGAVLLGLAGAGYRAATMSSSKTAVPSASTPQAATRALSPAAEQATAQPISPPAPPSTIAKEPAAPAPSALERPRARIARKAVAAAPTAATLPEAESEVALLTRAERLLGTTPNDALVLLEQHAERFPEGVLTQEREVMRIDAERALGRNAAANEHARAFLARFPRSAHRHRFEALLDSTNAQTKP